MHFCFRNIGFDIGGKRHSSEDHPTGSYYGVYVFGSSGMGHVRHCVTRIRECRIGLGSLDGDLAEHGFLCYTAVL
jgi:hypothetical protein